MGLSRKHDPSLSHNRPRGFCFCGTFSPSRRQIRSTRSLPTRQPPLEQRRDPAIAITAVLAGKLDDRLRERIFVFPPDRTIALRAARLVRQPACPALRHPMLLLCMVCCDTPSLRA
jgi:hypothetical protein